MTDNNGAYQPDTVHRIRMAHRKEASDGAVRCAYDRMPWPCHTQRVLAELDRLDERLNTALLHIGSVQP